MGRPPAGRPFLHSIDVVSILAQRSAAPRIHLPVAKGKKIVPARTLHATVPCIRQRQLFSGRPSAACLVPRRCLIAATSQREAAELGCALECATIPGSLGPKIPRRRLS